MKTKATASNRDPALDAAWQAFRTALNGLAMTDRERVRLYLEGAAVALEDWARAIRKRRG